MTEFQPQMPLRQTFFSFQGRINRKRFFFSYLLVFAVAVVAMGVLAYLERRQGSDAASLVAAIAAGLVLAGAVYTYLPLQAKRLHDMGYSASHLVWIMLLFVTSEVLRGFQPLSAMAIAFASAIAQLALFIARGDDGPNDYGLPRIPPRG